MRELSYSRRVAVIFAWIAGVSAVLAQVEQPVSDHEWLESVTSTPPMTLMPGVQDADGDGNP